MRRQIKSPPRKSPPRKSPPRKSPPTAALLSRQAFTEQVLARDGGVCVICGRGAADGVLIDAHHIIERRLWEDGGYYLDNGATLCDDGENGCHMKAEKTEISVETLREHCGVTRIAVPEDLYPDTVYDKWGNTILADGRRTMGPLYNDPSVRKVLAGFADLFTRKVKYPRTWHLPWSPGATDDDRVLKSLEMFRDRQVVVTRKMDGENFTGYPDASAHARSIDGRHHPSRDWAKTFWAQQAHDLPENWRIVAENLYAVHSLRYDDLPGYLMGTSIWDDSNNCLSWDETTVWFSLLNMPVAPVLWRGTWNEAAVRALHIPERDDTMHEGYVVRLSDSFSYGAFARSVAKYVRSNHVSTDRHWMRGRVLEANGLASRQTP